MGSLQRLAHCLLYLGLGKLEAGGNEGLNERLARIPAERGHLPARKERTRVEWATNVKARKTNKREARQRKARLGRAGQGKARQDKARQGKARQGKARKGNPRPYPRRKKRLHRDMFSPRGRHLDSEGGVGAPEAREAEHRGLRLSKKETPL